MKKLNAVGHAIQKGKTQYALTLLMEIVRDQLSDQQELRNSVIALSARYHKLQRLRQTDQLGDGEAKISENQIIFAAQELVEILREEISGRETDPFLQEEDIGHKTRILFFAANPVGKAQINLDKEIRQIEASLARAKLRDRFEFIPSMATRPNDFMRRILEVKPEFVHFSGHGAPDGLHMISDMDDSIPIPADALANVFLLFREVIGCVLLNACYSARQAEKIREYIPNVIGTTKLVGDDAAIHFASMFYTAIAEGQDIEFAYQFARLGMDLNELDGENFVMK